MNAELRIKVEQELKDKLAEISKQIGLNTSSLVRLAIIKYLKSLEDEK